MYNSILFNIWILCLSPQFQCWQTFLCHVPLKSSWQFYPNIGKIRNSMWVSHFLEWQSLRSMSKLESFILRCPAQWVLTALIHWLLSLSSRMHFSDSSLQKQPIMVTATKHSLMLTFILSNILEYSQGWASDPPRCHEWTSTQVFVHSSPQSVSHKFLLLEYNSCV